MNWKQMVNFNNSNQLRHPKTMTNGEINKELDKVDKRQSKLGDKLIAAGRGHERPSDLQLLNDPLALEHKSIAQRHFDLRYEVQRRYGSNTHRLPTR